MNIRFVRRRSRFTLLLAAVALAFVTPAVARPPAPNSYVVHNLVSDGSIPADHTDPHLVNAWGITRTGTSPWWVADNGTDRSTLYNGSGTPQSLVVTVPGAPTGTVFNGGASFVVTNGTTSGPARFLFDAEDGTISGWNPVVDPTRAEIAVTSTTGAIYKGLAIATTTAGAFLYAADFHNAHVDVFDGSFHPFTTAGGFVDPDLPAGFAPFGIQNLQGLIYVTYAQQDADAEDEVAGPGLGFVSMFDPDGHFLARVASGGPLNAPWGLAIAPAGFGRFSGNLLVGNFGDGRINAYDLATFEAKGHLKTPDHKPLTIDGLWGIGFGNGANAGPATTLFFAAGPDDESHGLFGRITAQE